MYELKIKGDTIANLRHGVAQAATGLKAENLDPATYKSAHGLPIQQQRMSPRLRTGLNEAGIASIGNLAALSADQFLALPGLGEASLKEAQTLIEELGLEGLV